MPLSVLRGEREPGQRWTDQDGLLATALTQYEAMLHPGCGHPMYESMDPENEDRYVAPLPMRCHACTAVEQRASAYATVPAPHALSFSAEFRGAHPQ